MSSGDWFLVADCTGGPEVNPFAVFRTLAAAESVLRTEFWHHTDSVWYQTADNRYAGRSIAALDLMPWLLGARVAVTV